MSESNDSNHHYLLGIDRKNLEGAEGTLEYHNKDGVIKKLKVVYFPACIKPRLLKLTNDEIDVLTREEFIAYCAAIRKFHDTYWPYSSLVVPTQMPLGQRKKQLTELEKFYRNLYGSVSANWEAADRNEYI